MTRRSFSLLVLSRESAELYQPDGVEVCISIRDPWAPPARLSPGFRGVLDLAFCDLLEAASEADVLFSTGHADEIVSFLEQWPELDRVVVHCHMGASRSPGVALGLCDMFDLPVESLEQEYPAWNRLVRRLLAAQRRMEE